MDMDFCPSREEQLDDGSVEVPRYGVACRNLLQCDDRSENVSHLRHNASAASDKSISFDRVPSNHEVPGRCLLTLQFGCTRLTPPLPLFQQGSLRIEDSPGVLAILQCTLSMPGVTLR